MILDRNGDFLGKSRSTDLDHCSVHRCHLVVASKSKEFDDERIFLGTNSSWTLLFQVRDIGLDPPLIIHVFVSVVPTFVFVPNPFKSYLSLFRTIALLSKNFWCKWRKSKWWGILAAKTWLFTVLSERPVFERKSTARSHILSPKRSLTFWFFLDPFDCLSSLFNCSIDRCNTFADCSTSSSLFRSNSLFNTDRRWIFLFDSFPYWNSFF